MYISVSQVLKGTSNALSDCCASCAIVIDIFFDQVVAVCQHKKCEVMRRALWRKIHRPAAGFLMCGDCGVAAADEC
jgi:hypothetical protein